MSGGVTHPVRIEHFRGDLSLSEIERALQYRGRDHHFSVIYLADGRFALRAHDEQLDGGYSLVAQPLSYVPNVAGAPVVFTDLSQVPTVFPLDTALVIIDLDLSGGSVDLTGWMPAAGSCGAQIRFRKVDNSPNKITWTDYLGIHYNFVNKRGEFITLLCDGTTGLMHIV